MLECDHHILGSVSVSALIVATIALLLLGAADAAFLDQSWWWLDSPARFSAKFKLLLPWHALVHVDSLLPLDLQRETYPSSHNRRHIARDCLDPGKSARLRPWLAIPAGFISASFATGSFLPDGIALRCLGHRLVRPLYVAGDSSDHHIGWSHD
jgi:hypothetical protein